MDYLVGLAKNVRLAALAQPLTEQAGAAFAATGEKQRLFGWLDYGAGSWDKPRRVVLKAEHTDQGKNPRDLATNLAGDARTLSEETYGARGEMENRVKEQQLGLFADRASCQGWWANQLRLPFSSAAYALLESIRRLGLAGTELARAQVGAIRRRDLLDHWPGELDRARAYGRKTKAERGTRNRRRCQQASRSGRRRPRSTRRPRGAAGRPCRASRARSTGGGKTNDQ